MASPLHEAQGQQAISGFTNINQPAGSHEGNINHPALRKEIASAAVNLSKKGDFKAQFDAGGVGLFSQGKCAVYIPDNATQPLKTDNSSTAEKIISKLEKMFNNKAKIASKSSLIGKGKAEPSKSFMVSSLPTEHATLSKMKGLFGKKNQELPVVIQKPLTQVEVGKMAAGIKEDRAHLNKLISRARNPAMGTTFGEYTLAKTASGTVFQKSSDYMAGKRSGVFVPDNPSGEIIINGDNETLKILKNVIKEEKINTILELVSNSSIEDREMPHNASKSRISNWISSAMDTMKADNNPDNQEVIERSLNHLEKCFGSVDNHSQLRWQLTLLNGNNTGFKGSSVEIAERLLNNIQPNYSS